MNIALYIDDRLVDLDENIKIPLNFVRDDVKDFFDKDSSYSKTFELPATHNNNIIFEKLFNVNTIQSLWNYRNVDAVMYIDSLEIFRGAVILKKIKKSGNIRYEINLNSNEKGFMYSIDNKELTDIEWNSEGDHYFNFEAVNDTDYNADVAPYVYTLIDYGQFPTGYTTLQSLLTDINVVDMNNIFKPSIFVKSIIDKIFENAGYTYTCKLFEEEWFKNLIIPYNRDVGEAQYDYNYGLLREDYYVDARVDTTYRYYDYSRRSYLVDYRYGEGDELNHDNILNINYEINLRDFADYWVDFAPSNLPSSYIKLQFVRVNANNNILASQDITSNLSMNDIQELSGWDDVDNTLKLEGNVQINAKKNETIKLRAITQGIYYYIESDGTYIEYYSIVNEPVYNVEDNKVKMNQIVPKDIKQKDFLVSILKMFNLYMERKGNNFIIKTRDEYYKEGHSIDWTEKVNRDEDIETDIQITDFSELNFKFKEDDDYHNKWFSENYQKQYGSKNTKTGNIYSDKESSIELIFAPTPFIRDKSKKLDSYVQLGGSWRTVIGKIGWDSVNGADADINDGFITRKGNYNTKPRILFRTTDNFMDPENNWYSGSPLINLDFSSGTKFMTRYTTGIPLDFASVDNSRTKGYEARNNKTHSFDLSFSKDWDFTSSYWDGDNLTWFWNNHLNNVLSPESRIINAYLALDPYDVNTLELDNKIYLHIDDEIGQGWYIINKIIDYIYQNDFTKVELIKIVDPSKMNIQYNYKPIKIEVTDIIDGGLNAILETKDLIDAGLNESLSGDIEYEYYSSDGIFLNPDFGGDYVDPFSRLIFRSYDNEEVNQSWLLAYNFYEYYQDPTINITEWTGDSVILEEGESIGKQPLIQDHPKNEGTHFKLKFNIVDALNGLNNLVKLYFGSFEIDISEIMNQTGEHEILIILSSDKVYYNIDDTGAVKITPKYQVNNHIAQFDLSALSFEDPNDSFEIDFCQIYKGTETGTAEDIYIYDGGINKT